MVEKQDQPEINIGLVGHIDHGKTSLVKAISGKWTDTHSEELKRGITIRLGYANASFYKCHKCSDAECYTTQETCPKCKSKCVLLKRVSFIDAPGHETLMATMLSGAAIMDGALLIIAANEPCPQPQTKEHLMALEIVGIKNIIIVQNKIDLVSQEEALKNYNEIKNFIKGTIAEHAPIIPVSAQHNININFLIKAIEENIKTPSRDLTKDPIMFIARSFDINKPGSDIDKLFGGVLGGVIKQGVLKIKDKIEIKPGLRKEHSGKITYESIITTIEGLRSGEKDIKSAVPGGSIGILTKLDPFLVKSDNLTGNIVGLVNKLPKVWYEFDLEHHLLKRVVGSKEDLNVEEIKKMEDLMLNVNSAATVGVVTEIKKNLIHVKLKIPVCAEKENRITISRRFGNRWRLIGYGLIKE